MSKFERFDLLIIQDGASVVCAIAPFNKALVGDLVAYEVGLGEVINKLEWIEEDGKEVRFVNELLPVYDVTKVYNLGYVKEENNAEELE